MHHFFLKTTSIFVFLVFFSGCTFSSSNQPNKDTTEDTVQEILSWSDEEFHEKVQSSYEAGKTWFLQSFRAKGLFAYQYDPQTDTSSSENNMIRQLMASRLLAEISQEEIGLRKMHRTNLEFIRKYWYRETENGKYGYIFFNNKSKLGANAMALRTLVWSPFFEEYTQEAQKLADGIISLLHEDGSFEPWFIEPSYQYDKNYLLTFYSGEAILALVEYGSLEGNDRYRELAEKAQGFYIDRYVANMDKNYYPAYVPWHTLALNKLYKLTGNAEYSNALFALNDKLLELQDVKEHIGRFYNPQTPEYGSPHVASDGVYTEGLIYAYEIAEITGDKKHQKKYKQALKLAFSHLLKLQYTQNNLLKGFNSHKSIGGFHARKERYKIRIDNVQHTLDAYRKILEVFPDE